ncbi:MAG: ATP-dependent DNA helicase RecG, partial [Balneolaceae bacterium]
MKLTDLPYLSSLRAQALQKHGIDSPEDLLMLFPFRYIDRTRVQSLSSLQGEQENITIIGTIKAIRDAGFDRKKRVEIILQDKQGAEVKGVWFRGGGYFKREYKTGEQVSFFGTVRIFGRDLSMAHPEVERIRSDREIETLKRIVPVYPGNSEFSKARITHRMLHNWINRILEQLPIQEFLPESLLESLSLPVRNQAFQAIHNPETMEAPAAALERFKFEELFLFELSMARLKQVCIEPLEGHRFSGPGSYTETFLNDLLPFQLTNGQSDALEDIRK